MDQSFETLLVEEPQPDILLVTLNRPAVANALNTQMGRDIHALFSRFLIDPTAYRCIVVTGAGEKAFCAGGDLKERNGMTEDAWRRQHVIFEQAYYAVMDCPIPVIAAVNGAAYGGGCELALAADFIYASSTARFALTETSLGIIPGAGGTQNLPRAVGTRRAKELILSATPFSAEEAMRWGMVNRVLPPAELLPQTLEMARRIASNAPIAVRQAKRAIGAGFETDLKTGLALEVEAYNRTVPTEDRREGVLAFNEKRKPRFEGR
ncbi:MAG: enoyl-CoA hydratase/isomerase family protein [Rhodospirillales bacterium]|nr:enoyl-CoA hydratase/isomerase family protein [Rhodospirillales bacterium]